MERRLKLVVVPAFVTLIGIASAAGAWSPDPDEQAVLRSGRPFSEVLPSANGAGQIQAAIDIAAPPKIVWTVMNDCNDIKRIVSTMVSCSVISSNLGHGWDVREQITKGNLFVPTIRNVVRNEYKPYTLIRFRGIGGDLRIEEGEWVSIRRRPQGVYFGPVGGAGRD